MLWHGTRLRHSWKKVLAVLVFIRDNVQCESKKNPPDVFWHFSPNGWEFLVQILHVYYTFLSMIEYKFLFNYLQLWRSYASEFLHFTRTLTSKLTYWANDVTSDVMSYPTFVDIISVCSLPVRRKNDWRWIAPTSSQRTNGHQSHQTSTPSTTMCGVQCFKYFTNFSQSQRPSQS